MTKYNVYRNDTDELVCYFRSLVDTAEYLNLTSEELQRLMKTTGRTDLLVTIDGESVKCRVMKHETVDQRDPAVGATVWSFVITDYGMARDGWEDEPDIPVRVAYSTRSAAIVCAKAAVLDWMLDEDDDFDPDEIPIRQAIHNQIYDDAEWKTDGGDLLWSSGDGPDEIRCRVYPITIHM